MTDSRSSQFTRIPPNASGPDDAAAGSASSPLPVSDDATIVTNRPPFSEGSGGRLPQPLEIGQMLEGVQLGQFLLQKFVGGGGMGVVFRALDTTLNRDVAVKVLSSSQSQDEETLRRFQNEAQSAARLDHENIARVHYVGEDRGLHYIVFEFIEGTNLRDLVEKRGPLPLVESVSYTLQISEALAHASQRDVIHRDIKPSNVLITPDGKAKLVDMGLARLHQVEHHTNDLTASGVTLGTFDYISPEQARDPRSADVRSDLYSLGCSFYYMLTGRPPFAQGTVLQKLLQHQGDEPPDPRQFRPDLPLEATQILTKMLAKDPARRYQKPDELIGELLILGEQIGLPASAVGVTWMAPVPKAPSVIQRHLSWIVPLAALLLIVLGLDFYWSRQDAASSLPNQPVAPRTGQTPRPARPGVSLTPSRAAPAAPLVTGSADGGLTNKRAVPAGAAQPDPASNELRAELENGGLVAAAIGDEPAGPFPRDSATAPTVQLASGVAADEAGSRRDGLLIVGDPSPEGTVYPSLQAACSAARNGNVIELRYNDRRDELPLTLENVKLTIRSGDGYQPVIRFLADRDPVKYPRSMLTVSGGQLTLVGVHLELDISSDVPSESWALVETRQAELVRLEKCSMTIRNAASGQEAQHPAVAFFDLKAAPGSDTMDMGPRLGDSDEAEHPSVAIQLSNCIARGEATFVRNSQQQPLSLTWDNGLLTTDRLLVAGGSATPPGSTGRMQVALAHVTAVMRSGMLLATNDHEAPYQLPIEMKCSDSILLVGGSAPLIEQRGVDRVNDYRKRLQWNADRNFYENVQVFWRIASETNPAETSDFSFSQWRAYLPNRHEKFPSRDAVIWKEPPGHQPLHMQTPDDYTLSTTGVNNRALGGGGDGFDVGLKPLLLPALPSQRP